MAVAGPLTPDALQKTMQAEEARARLQREHVAPLRDLANRYLQAAGHAFASGEDAEAATYREAAGKLTALANELPPLSRATR